MNSNEINEPFFMKFSVYIITDSYVYDSRGQQMILLTLFVTIISKTER